MRAAGTAALIALAFAGAARAAGQPIALPSPAQTVRKQPPLQGGVLLTERRFPRHVNAQQTVLVGVTPGGKPVDVVDVNRLVVTGKGDYVFGIPGPVVDVRAARGSESEPGLRTGTILWQGFSPGRRVLAARITLDGAKAAAALPVRLRVTHGERASTLEIENVTRARPAISIARARAREVAAALDASWRATARNTPPLTQYVTVDGPIRTGSIGVGIPLTVAGEADSVRIAERVAAGETVRVRLPGKRLTRLHLEVAVPNPATLLRPPAGPTWTRIARAGRLRNGRRVLILASRRILEAALARQYHSFLASPEPAGATRTTYELRVAQEAADVRHATAADGGIGWPWVALGVTIGVLVGAAALVAWAHS